MKIKPFVTGLLSLSLVACASTLRSPFSFTDLVGNRSTEQEHRQALSDANALLVVSNIVFVLRQLDELPPIQTTLQIKPPVTSVGRAVLNTLTENGYGLQLVDSDIGPHYVRYKFEEATTESGLITRFSMSVGDISVARDYLIREGAVLPDSVVEVRGAAEVFTELNDGIFENNGANYEADVVFADTRLPELSGPAQLVASTANLNNALPANGIKVIKENMYDARESNYSALFNDYQDVESTVLVFSNDSLRLGQKNKRIITDIASRMNPETDLVSVIGCSHGRTAIDNGNSVLAVGRAHRVKEAFVFAGVDYGKVLDEGCWARVHFDEMMPRRGVVLTLKRRKGLNG